MAEEKEYIISGVLCDDHTDLHEGEVVLRFNHWKALRRVFRSWVEHTTKLEVTLKAFRYQRSLAQNNFYWGVVIPTIRAFEKERTGITPSPRQIHAFNLVHVLGDEPKVETVLGKEVITLSIKSSSSMNTKEFKEFIEAIQSYFDELGCYIPDPVPKTNNHLTDFIGVKDT